MAAIGFKSRLWQTTAESRGLDRLTWIRQVFTSWGCSSFRLCFDIAGVVLFWRLSHLAVAYLRISDTVVKAVFWHGTSKVRPPRVLKLAGLGLCSFGAFSFGRRLLGTMVGADLGGLCFILGLLKSGDQNWNQPRMLVFWTQLYCVWHSWFYTKTFGFGDLGPTGGSFPEALVFGFCARHSLNHWQVPGWF